MDGFTYTNIFETKGIEYIAILAFFAILIPFWIFLNRQSKSRKRVQRLLGTLSPHSLNIPQGLFFSKNHTWVHLLRSGAAKVGLDDLLLRITGEVRVIRHAAPGSRIKKGELLAIIDHHGRKLSIFSPISGEVIAANDQIENEAVLINEDPFRHGWIYEIRPENWKFETKSYYLGGEATSWMAQEVTRFKDFIMTSMGKNSLQASGIIMQDGGELRENTLSDLPEQQWNDFQKEFLNTLG
jgi:glycine cleavage system H protein